MGTRAALNEVEAENIAVAVGWVASRRLVPGTVLDEGFLKDLHRRMFDQVWRWAGTYRRSDENLGVPWYEIGFTWGAGAPPPGPGARDRYLHAVRAADDGDIDPLLVFARC